MSSLPRISEYGYIDKTGNMVIKPQFDSAFEFSEGLAEVKIQGKYGFIDSKGKTVIAPAFDGAGSFSEGLAWVKVQGKYGFIDKTGKVVIEPQFTFANNFIEGTRRVSTEEMKNGFGYIDHSFGTTGKYVWQPSE